MSIETGLGPTPEQIEEAGKMISQETEKPTPAEAINQILSQHDLQTSQIEQRTTQSSQHSEQPDSYFDIQLTTEAPYPKIMEAIARVQNQLEKYDYPISLNIRTTQGQQIFLKDRHNTERLMTDKNL